MNNATERLRWIVAEIIVVRSPSWYRKHIIDSGAMFNEAKNQWELWEWTMDGQHWIIGIRPEVDAGEICTCLDDDTNFCSEHS